MTAHINSTNWAFETNGYDIVRYRNKKGAYKRDICKNGKCILKAPSHDQEFHYCYQMGYMTNYSGGFYLRYYERNKHKIARRLIIEKGFTASFDINNKKEVSGIIYRLTGKHIFDHIKEELTRN